MMEWYSRCAKIHPTLFRAEVCRDRGGDTAALPAIACMHADTYDELREAAFVFYTDSV